MCTLPNSQCELEEIVSGNRKKYVYQVTQFSSKSAYHLSGEVMQSQEIMRKPLEEGMKKFLEAENSSEIKNISMIYSLKSI